MLSWPYLLKALTVNLYKMHLMLNASTDGLQPISNKTINVAWQGTFLKINYNFIPDRFYYLKLKKIIFCIIHYKSMFNIRKSFSDIQSLTRSTFPFFNAFNVRSVALSDKTFILHSLFAHCSLIVQLDDNIFRLITINTCSLLFLCPTVNRLSSTLKRLKWCKYKPDISNVGYLQENTNQVRIKFRSNDFRQNYAFWT